MVYPRFSASTEEHDEGENESMERASLLYSIPAFRLSRSLPAEAAASRSRIHEFLGTDNIASYGSIADRNDDRGVHERRPTNTEEEEGADFVDIEEGTNRDSTATVQTVNSDTDNTENPNNSARQQQQSTSERPDSEGDEQAPRDGAIGNITRRLRCLFSTVTFPIVPLGTVVSLALLWVLYAAASLDLGKSCSHPLHSYALMSLLLVAYIPNHSQVRGHMFHYSRERDGPVRPTRVRMYDQFFHTVCLLYVYTGATLIETCREDPFDPNNAGNTAFELYEQQLAIHGDHINTCEASCPNLYQAMSVYVATLELFTFALILPLLFLPCIYLWFLQRATAEADAFARLQDRLQEEDALLSNGGVTTGEILNNLETVKIISQQPKAKDDDTTETFSGDESEVKDNLEQQKLWILPCDVDPNGYRCRTCETRECCICMTEFDIQEVPPEDDLSSTSSSDLEKEGTGLDSDENEALATNDEGDGELSPSTPKELSEDSPSTIVRTKCGHIFHKECLKGWVGGMWSANTNTGHFQIDSQHDWRKRKARQIQCPLCREDLRVGASSRNNRNFN